MTRLVIVGGGHAGAQLCASLAEGSFSGEVVLVSEEPHLPYHRPPLSKTFIKDDAAGPAELRNLAFYEQANVKLMLGTCVNAIDPVARTLSLEGQESAHGALTYDHLVLATGARARALPGCPAGASGIHQLRSITDAGALRAALSAAAHVLVLGGGFIGLELAATLRGLGKQVTVLEVAPRLLARAVSPEVSAHLLETHRAGGIDICLGQGVDEVLVEAGRFTGVRTKGELLKADLLIVSVGSVPETTLAQAAGLRCNDGIVVDEQLQTSAPHISAIGDCTSFPYTPWQRQLRLESVQNANEQAKTLAARLVGKPRAYANVPWFWSDQGETRLQITGLWQPGLRAEVRPGPKPGSFSALHFEGTVLKAAESINAAADHMALRRELQKPSDQL